MRTFGAVTSIVGGVLMAVGFLSLVQNFLPAETCTTVMGVGLVGIVVGQLFMKIGVE